MQAFFTGRVPPSPNGTIGVWPSPNGALDGNTTGAEEQNETAAPVRTPGNFTGVPLSNTPTVGPHSSTVPRDLW